MVSAQKPDRIRYDVGHGANDPFFIVRNEAEGESFIGHLAWTANREMEFKAEGEPASFGSGREPLNREANLHFKIGLRFPGWEHRPTAARGLSEKPHRDDAGYDSTN